MKAFSFWVHSFLINASYYTPESAISHGKQLIDFDTDTRPILDLARTTPVPSAIVPFRMQRRVLLTAAVLLPVALVISYSYSVRMSTLAATLVPASSSLSFVLFGATGRTGLPFMHQALARGHRVTAFTRSAKKVPAELAMSPNLTTVEVELEQSDTIAAAVAKAKPDVVYVTLASDPSPHTALSTGSRAAHNALRLMRDTATLTAAPLKPTPFIIITGWGLEPTRPLLRWYERAFVSFAASTFYAPVLRDAVLTAAELEAPTAAGVILPTQLMPPLLTNGALTTTYQYGDALTVMKDKMHSFDTVSRASLANIALLLGEQAVAGAELPKYVAVRQP